MPNLRFRCRGTIPFRSDSSLEEEEEEDQEEDSVDRLVQVQATGETANQSSLPPLVVAYPVPQLSSPPPQRPTFHIYHNADLEKDMAQVKATLQSIEKMAKEGLNVLMYFLLMIGLLLAVPVSWTFGAKVLSHNASRVFRKPPMCKIALFLAKACLRLTAATYHATCILDGGKRLCRPRFLVTTTLVAFVTSIVMTCLGDAEGRRRAITLCLTFCLFQCAHRQQFEEKAWITSSRNGCVMFSFISGLAMCDIVTSAVASNTPTSSTASNSLMDKSVLVDSINHLDFWE